MGQRAKAAKDTVKDKVEDVQEAWETSQVKLLAPTYVSTAAMLRMCRAVLATLSVDSPAACSGLAQHGSLCFMSACVTALVSQRMAWNVFVVAGGFVQWGKLESVDTPSLGPTHVRWCLCGVVSSIALSYLAPSWCVASPVTEVASLSLAFVLESVRSPFSILLLLLQTRIVGFQCLALLYSEGSIQRPHAPPSLLGVCNKRLFTLRSPLLCMSMCNRTDSSSQFFLCTRELRRTDGWKCVKPRCSLPRTSVDILYSSSFFFFIAFANSLRKTSSTLSCTSCRRRGIA